MTAAPAFSTSGTAGPADAYERAINAFDKAALRPPHLSVEPQASAEPTPLVRETPPGEPYPMDALGALRPAAEAIHDMTQAPPAIAAQSVLGVVALAVQALADVETLRGRAPASLFLLTVAASGERKSSCDKLAMQPVREFEAELSNVFREENLAYRNNLAVWEERRKEILRSAKSDPTTARLELDALGPEPLGPLYASIVAAEPTMEGITKHMDRLRPALGLFSDEGGAFIGGHAMNADNRLKTLSGFSRLWDGSPVDRWRAGEGVMAFPGRRISAHLMIQPIVAADLFSDRLATEQGFLARCLLTEPASAIGTRLRLGHAAASAPALVTFSKRVGDLLRRPLPVREGSRNELEPPLLHLSDEARLVLQDFHLDIERAQATGREFEGSRAAASKAAEQAARLSAILTLYADQEANSVSGETMTDAATLASFYVNEAARLADAATVSKETAEAERLRKWLREKWAEPFISATDAAQSGPFKETDRARRALETLERFGWVSPAAEGATIRGKRRRTAWHVVREGRP